MYMVAEKFILRTTDSAIIPIDQSNRDYQEFQSWVAAGNTAPPQYQPAELAKQRLAEKRYFVETGGCLFNGWPVATDRDAQSKISAAYSLARDGHWAGGWKFADGVYRVLTAAQVMSMALAVSSFVGACFAREAELAAGIDSGQLDWVW